MRALAALSCILAVASVGAAVGIATGTPAAEQPGKVETPGKTADIPPPEPAHVHPPGALPTEGDLLPEDHQQPPVAWFSGGRRLYVPKYYDTFKNLDISGLGGAARERFLHLVNTEFCSCGQGGCRRDTIANCYTNDASCPRAPVRIRQILESVKKSQAASGSKKAAPPSGR